MTGGFKFAEVLVTCFSLVGTKRCMGERQDYSVICIPLQGRASAPTRGHKFPALPLYFSNHKKMCKYVQVSHMSV